MEISISKIEIENFKGIKQLTVDFGTDNTIVKGQNAAGKTSVVDAFMWVLFNKDSKGVSKFNVRPLDSNNKPIDNTEIKVVLTLDIDGKTVTIQKIQKQKWTKKRGSDIAEFKGNTNEYEVDGFPKTEKDFKAYITELVNEEVFALVTNPMAFTALDWKKQRQIILKLVSDVTDADVIASNTDLFGTIAEQIAEHSVDDLIAREKKALSSYKKDMTELPARIDELEKSKSDVDVAEMELQKNCIKEQIEECNNDVTAFSEKYKLYTDIQQQIMQAQFDMSGLQQKLNADYDCKKRELNRNISVTENEMKEISDLEKQTKNEIHNFEVTISGLKAQRESKLAEYKSASNLKFDEKQTTCSMCGQTLPINKILELKEEFETKKKNVLDEIVRDGKILKEKIEQCESKKVECESIVKQCAIDFQPLVNKLDKLKKEYEALKPVKADTSSEYVELSAKIFDLENKLEDMDTGADIKQSLEIKRKGLNDQLIDVERLIASADNSKIESRISELEEEQRTLGQCISNCEGKLYTLEQFTKAKMEMISVKVSSKFKTVSFKLFAEQVNGGYTETCECTVNGVPYSDLNNGHRIIAGLDIINSLSELYGVKAPIFIDNAECLNDFNVPAMDTQLILLKVSDDKKLVVESEVSE